ncbi:2-oxo acid dehydrogenase subunit E2 [Klenkia sp. LSe6-5]|uniref:2-oxo acid dehydrogenase subunit E2 n=1 Tax=Klenkia sesuvii TaxID=3103137 RepID=A0ABU8DX03_9ACTN
MRFRARRRAIARNMAIAAAVPSLTADVRVDLTRVLDVRAALNTERTAVGEPKLSVQSFIARAAVDALAEHPDLNSTFTDAALLRWQPVNLSIAVDTTGGLVVPVIRNAQRLGVVQLASAIADLADRAKTGSLELSDLTGGTFTLSNPGAIGPSLRAEALLNPPQTALLGLPGMRREPVVVQHGDGREEVRISSVLDLSLTFDHRAVDGGEPIRYLVAVRDRLQRWSSTEYGPPTAA